MNEKYDNNIQKVWEEISSKYVFLDVLDVIEINLEFNRWEVVQLTGIF